MDLFGIGKAIAAGSVLVLATQAFAATPTFMVDLDVSGRTSGEVTEPNYIPWVIGQVSSQDTTISGVKIAIAKGSAGSNLRTTWNKAGVQSPNYARLVGDGVYVENGNSGGEISLTFSNLEAGMHTLLAYLNNCEAEGAYTFSDIDVYVNGTKSLTNVKPATRPLSTAAATTAFVNFTVSKGGSATVTFKPSTSSASFRNVTLNAFALNVANAAAQASAPSPADLDDQAASASGKVTLAWTAAKNAKKHRVYVGTDSSAVLKATTKSSEYKGELTDTKFNVSNLSPLSFCYWRIDEVDGSGTVTAGNVWRFRIGRAAFDGAEGYGRMAVGGRGGKVVYVTNLNDSGAGSLREAVENDIGPRTILFKVAGVINLKDRLTLSNSYVTVAGQSAPGKGVTITSAPFGSTGNNNVVRFMRLRLGFGRTFDGMGLTGATNSIMDHCSISWTIDEAFSSRGAKNITLQRTQISEALNIAGHNNYPAGTTHGYAGTISGKTGSFHHNLLAHNEGRNWSMGDPIDGNGVWASKLDIFNNVVYNYGGRATDGEVHQVNFVNNYYKKGPGTKIDYILTVDIKNYGSGTEQAYYHGNIIANQNGSFAKDSNDNTKGRRINLQSGLSNPSYDVFVNKPFFDSYANVQTAVAAFKDVLSDNGANMPFFDNHDNRIVKETKNGTTTYTGSVGKVKGIIDNESDVGGLESYPNADWGDDYDTDLDGLPDWWENMYGYNPKSAKGDFSDANRDRLGDGWTELERYLEWMARAHYTFKSGETQTVDLAQFTKGYDGGTYSVKAPAGVNATVNGSKVTISLAESFGGVGYVQFALKDKVGDTFTRSIGVTQQFKADESQSPSSSASVDQSSSSSVDPSSSASGSAENVYQAEDGILSGGAATENRNTGFNGNGYVNFADAEGSTVKIKVNMKEAGEYKVLLTYALGKDVTRKLSVKSTESDAQNVEFASTGTWNDWKTAVVSLKLAKGENEIVIATIDGDGPNLDQIELKGEGTTAIAPKFAATAFYYSVANNQVHFAGLGSNTTVTVMDMLGKSIAKNEKITGNDAVLDLQNMSRGFYLVNVKTFYNGEKMNRTLRVQKR